MSEAGRPSPPRVVRASRGREITCKGWPQEAALRMLMNNLDPEVAERPQDLIVYGGKGKAKDATAEATASKQQEPSPAERARQWWDKARTFEPRSEDAKSDIVSCKVDGRTRFMSQADCQNSGGRVSGG